jgi:hypothetical protein
VPLQLAELPIDSFIAYAPMIHDDRGAFEGFQHSVSPSRLCKIPLFQSLIVRRRAQLMQPTTRTLLSYRSYGFQFQFTMLVPDNRSLPLQSNYLFAIGKSRTRKFLDFGEALFNLKSHKIYSNIQWMGKLLSLQCCS